MNPRCQTSSAGRAMTVLPSSPQPGSLLADATPSQRAAPHFPPPVGVGFCKQRLSSPGKVQSEKGVQLQVGAWRASRADLGQVSLEAPRHPHPVGAPILTAGGPIFWVPCLPEPLPAPGGCSGKTMDSSLRCHLVASACQFPELGLSFLILIIGVGWE